MLLVFLYLLFGSRQAVAQNASERFNLSAVLKTQSQLTNFTTILELFPDLYDRASTGNITILAPTNDAFVDYLATFGNFTNTSTLRAGLSYHMIEGRYTPVDFVADLQFLPTLLTDAAYSNVTGGQKVGVSSTDQGIMFESGLKSRSNLTTPNIVYSAPAYGLGVIHIIDKMLQFPLDAFTTAAETGLDGVVGLSVSLPVNPNLESSFGAAPDWTLFFPNSSSVDISGWPTSVIFDIQEYHFVPGQVLYSPDLKNGTSMKTFSGPNLTITIAPNGTKYVNDAKIIYSDYLVNTGVLHVLEHGLSPNLTDARPNLGAQANSTVDPNLFTTPTASGSAQTQSPSLSMAAKAGIGVGVGVIVLIVIGALFFYLRRRRVSKPQDETLTIPELKDQPISEMQHPDRSYTFEADASAARARGELDGVKTQIEKPKEPQEMQ